MDNPLPSSSGSNKNNPQEKLFLAISHNNRIEIQRLTEILGHSGDYAFDVFNDGLMTRVLRKTRAPGLFKFILELAKAKITDSQFSDWINGGPGNKPPLIRALEKHLFNEALLLIKYGADVRKKDPNTGRTPLLVSVVSGDLDSVKNIIAAGAAQDLEVATFGEGMLPIHYAARNGELEIFKFLLETKKNFNAFTARQKDSSLMLAAKGGHLKIVEELLRYPGIHPNHRNNLDRTALHEAVLAKHGEIVKLLLKAGTSLSNTGGFGTSNSVLHDAVVTGDREIVQHIISQIMKEYAVDPNMASFLLDARNDLGNTPFMLAAQSGRIDLIELMLETGFINKETLNQHNYSGLTSLHLACREGNEATVKFLLEKDANVLQRAENGPSVLSQAVMGNNKDILTRILSLLKEHFSKEPEAFKKMLDATEHDLSDAYAYDAYNNNDNSFDELEPATLLMTAAKNGKVNAINALVQEGANLEVTQQNSKRTALHCACVTGNEAAVRKLLEFKADALARTKSGTTLREATKSDPTIFKLILEAYEKKLGKNSDALHALLNELDTDGNTVLMLIADNPGFPSEFFVKPLLELGADPNILSSPDKITALNVAIARRDKGLVKILLEGNASPCVSGAAACAIHYVGFHNSVEIRELVLDATIEMLAKRPLAESENLSILALNLPDSHGKTLLMYAAENGSLSMVKGLLSDGADINAYDKHGMTALHYALNARRFNVVRVLLSQNNIDVTIATDSHQTASSFANSIRVAINEKLTALQTRRNDLLERIQRLQIGLQRREEGALDALASAQAEEIDLNTRELELKSRADEVESIIATITQQALVQVHEDDAISGNFQTCLSRRIKRNVPNVSCVLGWEDIKKFNLDTSEDPHKIVIDSEKFIDELQNMSEKERKQALKLADLVPVVGNEVSKVKNLIRFQKLSEHFKATERLTNMIASGVMTKKMFADLLMRGRYDSFLFNGGYILCSKMTNHLADLVSRGEITNMAVKKILPFIQHLDVPLYFVALAQSMKALHDNPNISNSLNFVSNAGFLLDTLSRTAPGVAESAGLSVAYVQAAELAAEVAGSAFVVVGGTAFAIKEVYSAYEQLKKYEQDYAKEHKSSISFTKKTILLVRGLVGDFIKFEPGLLGREQIYQKSIEQTRDFLKTHPQFLAYAGAMQEQLALCSEEDVQIRGDIERMSCKTEMVEIPDNIVKLNETTSLFYDKNHIAADLLCPPPGKKKDLSQQDSLCKNAFAVRSTNATGKFSLMMLGDGNDVAYGLPNVSTVFFVGAGHKDCRGGFGPNGAVFILQGENITGYFNGGSDVFTGQNDSLSTVYLESTYSPKNKLIVNAYEGFIAEQSKLNAIVSTIKFDNIASFHNDRSSSDTIIVGCDTRNVEGKGFATIIVPEEDCEYQIRFILRNATRLQNKATDYKSFFKYEIFPSPGHSIFELSNSTGNTHLFEFKNRSVFDLNVEKSTDGIRHTFSFSEPNNQSISIADPGGSASYSFKDSMKLLLNEKGWIAVGVSTKSVSEIIILAHQASVPMMIKLNQTGEVLHIGGDHLSNDPHSNYTNHLISKGSTTYQILKSNTCLPVVLHRVFRDDSDSKLALDLSGFNITTKQLVLTESGASVLLTLPDKNNCRQQIELSNRVGFDEMVVSANPNDIKRLYCVVDQVCQLLPLKFPFDFGVNEHNTLILTTHNLVMGEKIFVNTRLGAFVDYVRLGGNDLLITNGSKYIYDFNVEQRHFVLKDFYAKDKAELWQSVTIECTDHFFNFSDPIIRAQTEEAKTLEYYLKQNDPMELDFAQNKQMIAKPPTAVAIILPQIGRIEADNKHSVEVMSPKITAIGARREENQLALMTTDSANYLDQWPYYVAGITSVVIGGAIYAKWRRVNLLMGFMAVSVTEAGFAEAAEGVEEKQALRVQESRKQFDRCAWSVFEREGLVAYCEKGLDGKEKLLVEIFRGVNHAQYRGKDIDGLELHYNPATKKATLCWKEQSRTYCTELGEVVREGKLSEQYSPALQNYIRKEQHSYIRKEQHRREVVAGIKAGLFREILTRLLHTKLGDIGKAYRFNLWEYNDLGIMVHNIIERTREGRGKEGLCAFLIKASASHESIQNRLPEKAIQPMILSAGVLAEVIQSCGDIGLLFSSLCRLMIEHVPYTRIRRWLSLLQHAPLVYLALTEKEYISFGIKLSLLYSVELIEYTGLPAGQYLTEVVQKFFALLGGNKLLANVPEDEMRLKAIKAREEAAEARVARGQWAIKQAKELSCKAGSVLYTLTKEATQSTFAFFKTATNPFQSWTQDIFEPDDRSVDVFSVGRNC